MIISTHVEAAPASHFELSNALVSRDFLALAAHMTDCQCSRGRFFTLNATLELLHGVTASRIVTTSAVFVACSLGLSLLTLA